MSYHEVGLVSPLGFMALMSTDVRKQQFHWQRRIVLGSLSSLIVFGSIGLYVGIIFFLCLYVISSLTLLSSLHRARRLWDREEESFDDKLQQMSIVNDEYRRFMALKLFSRAALSWHLWVIMMLVLVDMMST